MLTSDDLAWQASAMCAQTDPDAFHVDKGGSTALAKRICGTCEVRSPCLGWVMGLEREQPESHRQGVFGGFSAHDRIRLEESGWLPGDPAPAIPRRRNDAGVCPQCGKDCLSVRKHIAHVHRSAA